MIKGYSSSQATKQSLIDAAGELFARNGYAAVTTREIAKSACENIGSIHYHFGGKDGLLDAVIDYASQPWKADPFGRYLRENGRLFESKAGRVKLVEGIIDLLFDIIFSKELPEWSNTFAFQTLQRNLPGVETIVKNGVEPTLNAFVELHRRIMGDGDFERAHAWFHCVVSPVFLLSINPTSTKRAFGGELPSSYLKTMKAICKRGALFSLGLL